MNKFLASLIFLITLASCSNTPDLDTGEIKTLQLLKKALDESNKPRQFIDARSLLNREQVDAFKTPILFVELPSGQNGTLIPYPGQGIGQTWLGADGATITMEQGVLKASRGMGYDLMGSSSSMPPWSKINHETQIYIRELAYITGKNKISNRIFRCDIQKTNKGEIIEVWDVNFTVAKFEENCINNGLKFKNTYYVDIQGTVRRSSQYHSDNIGSVVIERLDK